jgi:uncharacterized protein (DUF1501 family)
MIPSARPSRRSLLQLGALGLGAAGALGGLSRSARASTSGERRFLFVFCRGGWDPACVLAPQFGTDAVDVEPDASPATSGGLDWVDHPERPSVRRWFEQHHARAAIVRGFEVQSVSHERCAKLLMTGRPDEGRDDWGAMLAAASAEARALPYLVLGGPSFTALHADQVVRSGSNGQLAALLDGGAITLQSDRPALLPTVAGDRLADAFVRNRAAALEATGRSLLNRDLARRYGQALDRIDLLSASGLDLSQPPGGGDRWSTFSTALDALEAGASRCVAVEYDGLWSQTWDTHSAGHMQSYHWEELFQYLLRLSDELGRRPGLLEDRLQDEVTVVVYSEMGRGPRLNSTAGKDHFTYTSALLFGGGIAGGRIVGGYTDTGFGRPTDVRTGGAGDTPLLAAHLGATLLTLGDIDPLFVGIESPAIEALLA